MLKGKISKFNSREMFKIGFFAKISFHKNLKKKKFSKRCYKNWFSRKLIPLWWYWTCVFSVVVVSF